MREENVEYLKYGSRRKKLKFTNEDGSGGRKMGRLFTGAVLVCALFCAVKAVHYLYTDPSFIVKNVKVEGNRLLTKDEVLNLAALPPKENIMKLNCRDAAKRVLSNPQVEKAEINRVFPSQIRIVIVERKPVAFAGRERAFQVDSRGALFPRFKAGDRPSSLAVTT